MYVSYMVVKMLVEPWFDIAGICGKQKRMRLDSDKPCHFAFDIQVGVLAKEGETGYASVAILDLFHFRYLDDIFEPAVLQEELERWVLQLPSSASRNNNIFDLVTKLQQGLKKHVVLVIVSDQDIIDLVRQIRIGIA